MTQTALHEGLYAITDSRLLGDTRIENAVEQAIRGGARVIQYREKHLAHDEREATARTLAALCRQHAIPLIINDDIELAVSCDAAGVHLGRDDSSIHTARRLLGPGRLIGVSCYDSMDRALAAADDGADYVAFGRFFPSRSKPDAIQAGTDLLTEARKALALPVVAIGGITPANGAELLQAGAHLLAAIEGVFAQSDIEAAASDYARLFK